jgi:hypothetical protein
MMHIDRQNIQNIGIAGLIGELSFEAYSWLISPILFGVKLEPANLVIGLTNAATGIQLSYAAAFAIHFLIGALGFAAVVYLVKHVSKFGYAIAGITAGFTLWFVAQGILAPLMGRSFMMGFGTYTQSSFVGHVGMTLLIAMIWKKLSSRQPTVFSEV